MMMTIIIITIITTSTNTLIIIIIIIIIIITIIISISISIIMEGKEAFGVWIKVGANCNFCHLLMPLNVHYIFHVARWNSWCCTLGDRNISFYYISCVDISVIKP